MMKGDEGEESRRISSIDSTAHNVCSVYRNEFCFICYMKLHIMKAILDQYPFSVNHLRLIAATDLNIVKKLDGIELFSPTARLAVL